MSKFEQHIKTSLENYSAEYNPAHWEDMQNRLSKTAPGKSSSAGKVLGIAAGVIATAGLVYFFSTNNAQSTTAENPTAQNVIANTSIVKDNAIKQEETQTAGNSQTSTTNSSSEKTIAQNAAAENKTVVADKTEPVVSNNTPENKTHNTQPETQIASSPTPNSSSLTASFHTNQDLICSGTDVKFIADATVPCTYRWDFGDRATSGEKSPSHKYAKAGNYIVTLKLTAKDKTSSEQANTITVNPTPIVDMNYSVSDDNVSEINFTVKGTNVAQWKWDFDDKQSSSEQNPVHIYTKKGNYNATVIGTSAAGCSFSDKMNVAIDNVFPFAPNSFSLNQDGINDTWFIPQIEGYSYDVKIFNNSGTMVKALNDKNDSWDGAGAKEGDRYLWKASVKDKNGKTTNYQDYIVIVK